MNLTVQSAQLPNAYVEARGALEKCERVDECKDWSDRALALASYARQAKDDTLLNMARRIQLRAIRRGGVLLAQIDAAHGANQNNKGDASLNVLTRTQAAEAAGMSDDQRKQALRIANVPADDFERQVESAAPPTVEALAEQGVRRRAPPPAPHREEWSDWVFGVKRLREIPPCGLDVLARRDGGIARDRLLADARCAVENIGQWIVALDNADRRPQ